MKRFNEGTNVVAAVNFIDAAGVASIPTSVHYQLRNVESNTIRKDWTSVSPAAYVEIDIAAGLVTLTNQGNKRETQELTVVANKDTDGQIPEVVQWTVVNLRAIA
jgi:hypothetical protein